MIIRETTHLAPPHGLRGPACPVIKNRFRLLIGSMSRRVAIFLTFEAWTIKLSHVVFQQLDKKSSVTILVTDDINP